MLFRSADLDAVGNTTKAVTKGVAIGSAVIAAVSLFASFITVIGSGGQGEEKPLPIALFDHVAGLGGQPVMWKTGHSLMKTKMVETAAPLGGEMSGHMFFAGEWYGFDDALFAGVRLIQILANNPTTTLAELKERLPKAVNTPELRFSCPEEIGRAHV